MHEYSDLIGKGVGELFKMEGRSLGPSDLDEFKRASGTIEVTAKLGEREFAADLVVRSFSAFQTPKLLIVVEDVSARHEIERMKEEFVSLISHDLRAPLASIKAFLGLLKNGIYDQNLSTMKEKAEGIESDTTRLLEMINRLLELHKAEAGRLELFIELIPLTSIVKRSIQSIELLAAQKGIEMVTDHLDPSVHVRADADYAIQVLVNLLSNAIKFSPSGKIVRLTFELTGATAKIKVHDRGQGIKEEFRNRLFNKFEQSSIADARLKGGSGLGLAISKSIVEQHGGTIGVESEEGQGSTFWFTLPQVIL